MTIKEGRYYLDGMGVVRGPMIMTPNPALPFRCPRSFDLYESSGRSGIHPLSDYDLTTECDKDGNLINNKPKKQ